MRSSFYRYLPVALFTVILIAWLGLVFWRLTFVTLWSDEYSGTLQLLKLPWKSLLIGDYDWDFNPPLYFLGLRVWQAIFGNSETMLRGSSILLSAGSLAATFFLGRMLGDWRSGLGAMTILAFHPVYLHYATELRMYPLLLLFSQVALLSFTAYTSGRQRSTVWLAILVACAALAPYSHYFGVLVGAGVLVLSLCFLLIERDRRQLAVIRALVIAGVLASPVIFLASRQLQLYADKASTQELVFTPMGWQSLPALFSGSLTFELQPGGWLLVLSLLAVAGGFWALWIDKKKALAVGLAGFTAIAWLAAGFLSLQNVNIAPRYLMHVAFIPWLLVALSLARSPDRRRTLPMTLAVAAIVLYSLVGIRSTLNREYLAPDWRQVAQILEQEARRREPVVVMGWDAIPIEYYTDKTIFTSYGFVDQLPRHRFKSYLIVNSEHARVLDFLDFTQSVIYEDPQEKIKIIRYFP